MRVLKVQPVVDPRSYKLVKAIESLGGVEVSSAVWFRVPYSEFYMEYSNGSSPIGPLIFPWNRFTKMWNVFIHQVFWPQNRILSRRISRLARSTGAELIHTNGSPDFLGAIGKRHSELPVVHEIYDTMSLYDLPDRTEMALHFDNNPVTIALLTYIRKRMLKWEEFVHKRCNAVVYTSDEMQRLSMDMYGEFKSVVVPNGVLREFLPVRKREKLNMSDGKIHCVYLGTVSSSPSHRNIASQLESITKSRDIVLHLYPVTTNPVETRSLKERLGAHKNVIIHAPVHYRELYDVITQYDLGLVVLNPRDERLLNVAVPNKVFEYAAAGLPIAVPNYESLRNFVSEYRCGFVVRDWSTDISENLHMVKEVLFREEFTIDYYIPRLVELYKSLV
jgi:glycosyltransferase involved in cell wall biosynthesis